MKPSHTPFRLTGLMLASAIKIAGSDMSLHVHGCISAISFLFVLFLLPSYEHPGGAEWVLGDCGLGPDNPPFLRVSTQACVSQGLVCSQPRPI